MYARSRVDESLKSLRILLAAAVCLVGLSATQMLDTSPALAAQSHAFSTTIGGGIGSEGGQLKLVFPRLEGMPNAKPNLTGGSGVAVNDETHDVYVADTENHRVTEFSSSRTFIRAFGADVGGTGINTCTSNCKEGTSGSAPGQLEKPNFIAVDNSHDASNGDVYVATGVGRQALEEVQHVQINGASGGTFTLTFKGQTAEITYSSSTIEMAQRIQEGLEKLSTIGAGNISVGLETSGVSGLGEGWRIIFRNALTNMDVPQITGEATGLSPAGAIIKTSTLVQGVPFTPELMSKFDKEGHLIETWGNDGSSEAPNGQLVGSSTEHFEPLVGIAVDTAGNLWAYDRKSRMFEFNQEGNFVREWKGANNLPWGIGVDSMQNLYLPDEPTNLSKLETFSSVGVNLGRILFLPEQQLLFTGLTIDPKHNDMYADEGGFSIEDVPLAQCKLSQTNSGGCFATQVFGSGDLNKGSSLAVDSETGTVYAVSVGDNKIAVFPVAIEAVTRTLEPGTIGGDTATLEGNVNTEGAELTRCKFEYGTTMEYGNTIPCEESLSGIGTKDTAVGVSAHVSSLTGGTTYHFRLHVTNAHGDVHSEDGSFLTKPLPMISGVEATELTASSVNFTAGINPEGIQTSYDFEYGTADCAHSTCTRRPASAVVIGTGTLVVKVSQHIEGLKACTTYHFRVLALAEPNGTTISPDNTFVYPIGCPGEITEPCSNAGLRTENESTTLPDCRSYEMVTPAYTGGFTVFGGRTGSGIIVGSTSNGAFGGAENNQQLDGEYEFTRESSGWKTTPLDPAAAKLPESRTQIEAFSSDLQSYVSQFGLAVPGTTPTPQVDFYLRGPAGILTAIGPATPSGTLAEEGHRETIVSEILGASTDLSHIVFSSKDTGEKKEPFWPEDKTFLERESLYEYTGTAKQAPVMVAVTGPVGSHDVISQCGSSLGAGIGGSRYNAVSGSGTRIFFSVNAGGCEGFDPVEEKEEAGTGPSVPEIYARLSGEKTVNISEPSHEDCEECQENTPTPATYLAASEDGSKVLFATNQKLLPADTDSTQDIYEYDFTEPAGHKIIQVSSGGVGDLTPGSGAEVQGIMTVTPDLSHIFFVAKGVLSSENAEHNSPTEGDDNLYAYDVAQRKTVFVATLAPGACDTGLTCSGDAADWDGFSVDIGSSSKTLGSTVTPDGRFLLFPSSADLTSDDSSSASQLFQYDTASEKLIRVSIGQNGYDDNGNASIPIAPSGGFQSTDGKSVFFESTVPLVPQASKSAGFNSVYEWETNGTGACSKTEGCVYLISDGIDEHDINSSKGSTLIGISSTGSDVYFQTADSLIPADTNTQEGIFDARVGGGFPASVKPVSCSIGGSCQAPPNVAPSETGSSTFRFSGPVNQITQSVPSSPKILQCSKGQKVTGGHCMTVKAKKCAKGKKLRRGKCVSIKAKARRKSRARRSSGRAGNGVIGR